MNLQRREEISVLLAEPVTGEAGQALEYRDALMECRTHIDTLEQTAAERVIRGGSSGPTPDYTGEGSAWVPPVEARAVVVPEHAAWLTIDEMANALVLEFGTPIAAAKGFAKAIADASIAKGSRAIPADQSDWPEERVGGWAPGMYSCRCQECRAEYMGDKRSWLCYPCAKKVHDDAIANNAGAGI